MIKVETEQVEQTLGKLNEGILSALKEAINEVAGRIIEDTPVLTGKARSSWYLSVDGRGSASSSVDTEGGPARQQIQDMSSTIKGSERVFIENELPYIRMLEDREHMTNHINEMEGILQSKLRETEL